MFEKILALSAFVSQAINNRGLHNLRSVAVRTNMIQIAKTGKNSLVLYLLYYFYFLALTRNK